MNNPPPAHEVLPDAIRDALCQTCAGGAYWNLAMKRIDVSVGTRYGRLVVLEEIPKDKNAKRRFRCKCDCGVVIDTVLASLRNGRTLSCGCRQRDLARDRCRANKYSTKHGMCNSLTYTSWQHMKRRCCNPTHNAYCRYGGRGIKICERWLNSFENFLEDMGERPSRRHSIDRINNDGDYCPENCRWATYKQQLRNTHRKVVLTVNGRTLCVAEWAEKTGLPYMTIYQRMLRGWDAERILT